MCAAVSLDVTHAAIKAAIACNVGCGSYVIVMFRRCGSHVTQQEPDCVIPSLHNMNSLHLLSHSVVMQC